MTDTAPHHGEHVEVFRHDGFGKKIGPLPMWAWAVILVAGAAAVYYFYTRNQSSASVAGEPVSYPAYSDTGNGTDGSASDMTGGASTGSSLTDNQSWINAALSEASALGVSPTDLNAALNDFLNGNPITTQQQSWVDQAISSIGAPPTGELGISPITGQTAPTVTTSPLGLSSANFAINPTITTKGVVQGFTVTNKQTGKQVGVTSKQLGGASAQSAYNYLENVLSGSHAATSETAGGAITNLLKSIGGV